MYIKIYTYNYMYVVIGIYFLLRVLHLWCVPVMHVDIQAAERFIPLKSLDFLLHHTCNLETVLDDSGFTIEKRLLTQVGIFTPKPYIVLLVRQD